MTKTISNQRSYSDVTNGVWIAPLGTALPSGPLPTAWPAGWNELGFLTDKGVIESAARQKTKKWNWQGGAAARSLYNQPEHTFAFECNEENSHVLRLARPGSTVSAANGTNAVQTITISGTPTGGTFTLTYNGATTSTIAFNAAASAVQTALQALSTIGSNNVAVTGGPGPGTPYVVTFQNALGNQVVNLITANGSGLTGGTGTSIAVANTTPGLPGINTTNIKAYTGTDYWMFGIDLVDGSIHKRYIVQQGDAALTGSINYTGTDLTIFAFTVDAYPDSTGTLVIDLNDNPALAATS